MLLFAGHHKASRGAKNEYTSEYSECSNVCSMISCKADIEYFTNYTIKQKKNIITTLCDSLNIDIHFSSSSKVNAGPVVLFQPDNNDSKQLAEIFQNKLNSISDIKNKAQEGFYHGERKYGVDYFLQTDHPSIIINLDHWSNYELVINNVDKYVDSIVSCINILISKD